MRKLKDAIYGLAIGDALGVPVEFRNRDTFKVEDMLEYGSHNQPKGTWSDDTSLTLATCYSIKRMNCVDVKDILACFRMWLNESKFTATDVLFDVGMTTARAIRQGYGLKSEFSNGNGSLMRIIPLAFVDNIQDIEIEKVSAITHAHDISCMACVYYVNIAKALIQGKSIMQAVKESIPDSSSFANIKSIDKLDRKEIKSSGYVVDSFEAAIWCVATTTNFEECVLKAVNLGSDTDTTGAIAGALAGIIYGYENTPEKWIENLKNKELIEECLF